MSQKKISPFEQSLSVRILSVGYELSMIDLAYDCLKTIHESSVLQAAKVEDVIPVICVADDIQKNYSKKKNRLGETTILNCQFMSVSTQFKPSKSGHDS